MYRSFVSIDDLIEIYVLFIRSITEYCLVAFHSSLTVEQANDIERIQKTSLKVILGELYIDFQAALEMCGLQTLYKRREARCLEFALKCCKHSKNARMFPLNSRRKGGVLRTEEKFVVNFARTEAYRKSRIPYCQRLLNQYFNLEHQIHLYKCE